MRGTYNGRMRLNVREGASLEAAVVRTMEPGESIEVYAVDGGWAETPEGFVMADKLDLAADDEQPSGAVGESGPTGLEAMKVAELRKLAEESGIELRAGMKKADIIAAILS